MYRIPHTCVDMDYRSTSVLIRFVLLVHVLSDPKRLYYAKYVQCSPERSTPAPMRDRVRRDERWWNV